MNSLESSEWPTKGSSLPSSGNSENGLVSFENYAEVVKDTEKTVKSLYENLTKNKVDEQKQQPETWKKLISDFESDKDPNVYIIEFLKKKIFTRKSLLLFLKNSMEEFSKAIVMERLGILEGELKSHYAKNKIREIDKQLERLAQIYLSPTITQFVTIRANLIEKCESTIYFRTNLCPELKLLSTRTMETINYVEFLAEICFVLKKNGDLETQRVHLISDLLFEDISSCIFEDKPREIKKTISNYEIIMEFNLHKLTLKKIITQMRESFSCSLAIQEEWLECKVKRLNTFFKTCGVPLSLSNKNTLSETVDKGYARYCSIHENCIIF